jgi:DNA-binding transcriptional ArsR family regulator
MPVIAHIGKIPVEEWLPFLVPLVALYAYGRHTLRRRRSAVAQLPGPGAPPDAHTLALVRERWAHAGHSELRDRHLVALYPPGPDGLSAEELAARAGADPQAVGRALAELAELGYLDVEDRAGFDGRRAWLTFSGFELVEVTEAALLDAATPVSSR